MGDICFCCNGIFKRKREIPLAPGNGTWLDVIMKRGKFEIFLLSALGRDTTLQFKITANQSHTIQLPCTAQKIKG